MKKLSKGLVVCLLTCYLWTSFLGKVSAAPASPPTQSGFNFMFDSLVQFPDDRVKAAKQKGYEVQYTKYKPSRYYLEIQFPDSSGSWDVDQRLSDSGYFLLHNILVNSVWQLLLIWDFLVISGIENGFSLDIVNLFADKVDAIIQKFVGFNGSVIGNSGIWGNFLTLLILLAGAWIAYKGLYKRDTSSAWSGIISTIFILMASLAFFNNSSGIMHYLNNISSGISQEIMGIGLDADMVSKNQTNQNSIQDKEAALKQKQQKSDSSIRYSPQVASFVVADKLYDMLIYQPYLMMQYGKTSGDPQLTTERIRRILNYKPGSAERIQTVNEERVGNSSLGIDPNVMVTSLGVFQRLSLLGLLVISHLILGTVFLFIAGAILVYQFIFVIFALFAPFALLMALYPAWSSLAMEWSKKFVGYQILKIVVGVLLSMILTLSQFLYELTPPQDVGYAWTIVMQLVLTVGIIWKRKELISIVNGSLGKFVEYTDNSKDLKKQFKQYLQTATTRIEKIRFPR